MPTLELTAGDLRAALARAQIANYIIAGRARVHPVTLSRLLREREPLSQKVAQRIMRAIELEVADRVR